MDTVAAAANDTTAGSASASLPSRSNSVLVTSAVFLAVATIFVVMRSISKFGIRKRADIDDGVIILAWLFTVALIVTVIVASVNGLGRPDKILQQHPEWWRPLKTAIYVFPIFYHLSSMTAKTAALILYIRMARAHQFLRYASFAVLVIVDISGVVLILMNIFQCRPLSAAWTWNKEGQCIDLVTLFLASSPINILSDLAILYLPLPIITGLRIERTAKIGLVLAFLCGIFVAVVDVVRIAYLQAALKTQLADGRDHVSASDRPPNYYWTNSWGVMWSAIECSVRVACCCALVLKPFLQKLWPSSFFAAAASSSRQAWSNRRSANGNGSGGSGGAAEQQRQQNGIANGNANPNVNLKEKEKANENTPPLDPDQSMLSHKSMKNLPIQAILERDPDSNEDDCMDLMEFFAGGPPEPGLQRASAFSGNGGEPSSPRLGIGHFGLSHVKSNGDEEANGRAQPNESPASTDTMGAPLVSAPTRLSTKGTWTALTAPIRWITNETAPVDQTQQPTQRFFDAVHMGGRKPLTELTPREAWWPIMFVNILFFLWGFSYGLLGNLNSQILKILPHSTPARGIALQNSYWLGYIIGPSTIGAYTLTKHGFKATFMSGLVIYGCGAMCFWPSSVLASYGGFVFCNILVAVGLSLLEVAANPFIALAGPGELSEARLNFSQGIQAVASIISPILAEKVFFRTVDGRVSLFDVQWCYLAVALFVLLLALIFFYVPLSEASDDDLEMDTVDRLQRAGLNLGSRAFHNRISARWFIIVGGVIVQAFYVGAQESLSYFWNPYIADIKASRSRGAFWDLTIAHGLFACSRFLAAAMCYTGFTPRLVLNICLTGTFLTTLLAVVLPNGNGAYICILLALFFEGPVFPTLFATAIRGQGRRTKYASVAITASIGLAVIWQSSTWAIYQRTGDIRKAFILVTVLCFAQALYPILLDSSSVLRKVVDPKWSLAVRRPAGRQSIASLREPLGMINEKDFTNSTGPKANGNGTTVTIKPRGSGQSGSTCSGDAEIEHVPHLSPQPPPPALPRVPEETGPTDDFAGIGVVGELEEIK